MPVRRAYCALKSICARRPDTLSDLSAVPSGMGDESDGSSGPASSASISARTQSSVSIAPSSVRRFSCVRMASPPPAELGSLRK